MCYGIFGIMFYFSSVLKKKTLATIEGHFLIFIIIFLLSYI